jgi:hypothetical protein
LEEERFRAIVKEARNAAAGSDTLTLSNLDLKPDNLALLCKFFRETTDPMQLSSVLAGARFICGLHM